MKNQKKQQLTSTRLIENQEIRIIWWETKQEFINHLECLKRVTRTKKWSSQFQADIIQTDETNYTASSH